MGQLPQRPVAIWCVWPRAIRRPSFPPHQLQKAWPQKLCLVYRSAHHPVPGVRTWSCFHRAYVDGEAKLLSTPASAVSLAVWPVFQCRQTASLPWISTPVPLPRSRHLGCSHQPFFFCLVSTTFIPPGHRVPPRLPPLFAFPGTDQEGPSREASQLPQAPFSQIRLSPRPSGFS